MAAMARAATLMLTCYPRGRVEEVRSLCNTCTRWHMALHIGIRRLMYED